jgi:hypothetical protein
MILSPATTSQLLRLVIRTSCMVDNHSWSMPSAEAALHRLFIYAEVRLLCCIVDGRSDQRNHWVPPADAHRTPWRDLPSAVKQVQPLAGELMCA